MLLKQLWDEYCQKKDSHSEEAKEQALFKILSTPIDSNLYKSQQQDCQQIKEQVILELGNIYIKQQNPIKIQELIQKDVFSDLGKTKMAKVIRNLIDQVSQIENSTDIQIELCEYLQQWCVKQKRTYLRQRIEIKLANLLQQKKEFQRALNITEQLIKEVRKADDKHLMVEIQLVDSIIYYRIKNMAKAKASLTAARACSNQIYCPIVLQAEIDKMNGILLAEDKDYKTAYSYFYESFEAYNSLENPKALFLLKYMLLSKIMSNHIDDVNNILSSKHGLKYSSDELESMKQVSIAHSKKSLLMFQKVLDQYRKQIYDDEVVNSHIQCLYNNLLENNLKQIVEPYSKVQIGFVAESVNLDKQLVQDKLSEMILDKKIQGTLDQGNDCLILFDDLPCDDLYKNSIEKMSQMNLVVDKLFEKTKLLKTH